MLLSRLRKIGRITRKATQTRKMTETFVKTEMSKSAATLWFWSVAGFFAALWVLLPALLHTGYRNDVIELQSIAPEWVWATKKHPMLPAWMLEMLNILTGRAFFAPFIAIQLCAILTFWSVWKLGRTVLDERLALMGALSILPYSFFTSPMYNQNNVLIAFWALSIYLVFWAFQTNQKRYWIGAGIALGLTFHAKYSAVCLVFSILAYMFMRKEGRKYFRTPGPYLTTLVTFLVFLPHLIWLTHYHFAPLTYAESRPVLAQWYQQILAPLNFTARQLLYWLPATIILIPIIGFVWQWKVRHHEQNKAKECEKFLFYCFMIPLICHMLYCGLKGVHLRMAYGAPFWVFGGLWLLLRFQEVKGSLHKLQRGVVLAIAFELFIISGFIVAFYLGKQPQPVYYPMREFGTTCEQLWHSQFSGSCPYIAGEDNYLVGFAAHAMSVRPSVIIPQGTWATDDDLNQKGGMIVWERTDDENNFPETLHRRFPQAEVLSERPDLPYKIGGKESVLRIGIALVPPT